MCDLVFVKEIQGCQKMLKTISNLKLVWWTINCLPCAGFEIRHKKVIQGARGAEFQHDVKHTLLGIDLMEAHNVLMTIEPLQKSDFIFTQRIFVGVNVFPSKSFLASILLYFLHGSKLPSSKASDDSVVFRDLLGTSTAFRNFAWSWHGENMAGCLKRFSTQLIFGPNMFLLDQHTMAAYGVQNAFRYLHALRAVCICMYMCVCESNSVPKRSKLLFLDVLMKFSRRGTQEAHRAVSNEALYGVFRISGLITLTYLHLWNCWQAVSMPCFPALGKKNPFPTIPFSCVPLDQFLSGCFQFSFFNCFNPEWAKFIQLWFCALNLLLTEYKFSPCFFPQLETTWLMASYKWSLWYTCSTKKNVEILYPVFVTYQVCVP